MGSVWFIAVKADGLLTSPLPAAINEEEAANEIQVEFEARGPEEEDYQGIRRLLQQLFVRNTVVNIGKIAEAILGQKYLGSVIKQSVGEVEDDDEDDLDDPNEVYAVSTVISLAEKQKESVAGIRSLSNLFRNHR